MKTIVILEFTHTKPIENLADKAAARAYTLDGVDNCEVVTQQGTMFTEEEIRALHSLQDAQMAQMAGWGMK